MNGAQALPVSLPPERRLRVPLRVLRALGATAAVMPRIALADDPAPLLSRWSWRLLRSLGVAVRVEGQVPGGACLWVANHLSWLDAMVLMALRPQGTLAKAEVAAYPILGRGAARAGLRFVDRANATSRAAALVALARSLQEGRPMALFAEGTTTRGERLAPLYRGGLLAAHRLGVPVLPLRLASDGAHYPWTGDESLWPHLCAMARAVRTEVRITAGPLLIPDEVPNEDEWIRRIAAHLEPRG